MILSSCHHCSLNNDCHCCCHCHGHCHCCCHCHGHCMQRIYVYFILSCHAYNNNSNTSPLKTMQGKARQDEIYIESYSSDSIISYLI